MSEDEAFARDSGARTRRGANACRAGHAAEKRCGRSPPKGPFRTGGRRAEPLRLWAGRPWRRAALLPNSRGASGRGPCLWRAPNAPSRRPVRPSDSPKRQMPFLPVLLGRQVVVGVAVALQRLEVRPSSRQTMWSLVTDFLSGTAGRLGFRSGDGSSAPLEMRASAEWISPNNPGRSATRTELLET